MPTLSVELNWDGVHSIRAPDRFTTNRPFAIELENLGRSTHVHLHFDDDLDRVASLAASNHYVEEESVRRIHVDAIDPPRAVAGKLKIVTGYGSGQKYVDVVVEPSPETPDEEVVVDESLSKPPAPEPESSALARAATAVDTAVDRGALPAVGVALVTVAVALAVGVATGTVVGLAVLGLVVGAALGAAIYALR